VLADVLLAVPDGSLLAHKEAVGTVGAVVDPRPVAAKCHVRGGFVELVVDGDGAGGSVINFAARRGGRSA